MQHILRLNFLLTHRHVLLLSILGFCLAISNTLSATVITSTQSGDFTTGTTWALGLAPASSTNDTVVIANGDTVRLTGPITLKYLIIDAGGVLDNMSNALYILTMQEGANGLLFTINGLFTGTAQCKINLSSSTASHNHINGTGIIVTGRWGFIGNSSEPAAVFQIDTTANLNFSLSGGGTFYGMDIGSTSTYINMECYGIITLNTGSLAMGSLFTDPKHRSLTIGSTGNINILAGNLNMADNTTYNNGIVTIVGNVNNGGGSDKTDWYNYANSTLNVTGFFLMQSASASITGHLFADYANNTINYKGSGSQRLLRYFYPGTTDVDPNATYWHLKCSNAGIKRLLNNIIVKGDLTIRNSAQLDASTSNYNIDVKGHWYDSSDVADPFVERIGTVIFSDTGNQSITEGPVVETFYSLTISNGGIKSLNNNIIVNGNLTIQDSAQLDVTATPYNIDLAGNWLNTGTNDNPFVERTGTVTFNGTSPQTITSDTVAAGETFYNLIVNNSSASGDTLKSPVTITNSLTLTDGIVFTDATNVLTLNDNVSCNEGSSASFVDGLMKKIGNDAFVFPLGDSAVWARMAITAPSGITTQYTAQYIDSAYGDGSAPGDLSTNGSLHHVSGLEYWTLTQTVNDDDVKVTLYWEDAAVNQITDCSDLAIGHYSGGIWMEETATANDGGGSCTGNGSGSITTNAVVASYSPFTLASKYGHWNTNPLPIELLNLEARSKDNKEVELSWTTATETNNDYFTVERISSLPPPPTGGGDTMRINFIPIGTVKGAGNSNVLLNYQLVDESPLSLPSPPAGGGQGVRYYRLKQTDFDGKYSYSSIISIRLQNSGTFTMYPNPATGTVNLNIQGEKEEPVSISILDKLGRTIINKKENMKEGINIFNLDISALSNGAYLLQIIRASGGKEQKQLTIINYQ